MQNICNRTNRSRRTINLGLGLTPALAKAWHSLIKHGLGCHDGLVDGCRIQFAMRKMFIRPSHTAHAVRLQLFCSQALPKNELG